MAKTQWADGDVGSNNQRLSAQHNRGDAEGEAIQCGCVSQFSALQGFGSRSRAPPTSQVHRKEVMAESDRFRGSVMATILRMKIEIKELEEDKAQLLKMLSEEENK